MFKKILLNFVLFGTVYVVPLYLFNLYQNDYRFIDFRQNAIFLVLFFGSAFLIYLNNKYRKQEIKYKWIWLIFEIVGLLGLCYSGFVLALLFAFRNCCGF